MSDSAATSSAAGRSNRRRMVRTGGSLIIGGLLQHRRHATVYQVIGAGDEAGVVREEEGGEPCHLDRLADPVERMLGAPDLELLLRVVGMVHGRDRAGERRLDRARADGGDADAVMPVV